jgi:hypothetical protein
MSVNIGDTIVIDGMLDEPKYNGSYGVVQSIDDLGELHGTWGKFTVIPDVDQFHVEKRHK